MVPLSLFRIWVFGWILTRQLKLLKDGSRFRTFFHKNCPCCHRVIINWGYKPCRSINICYTWGSLNITMYHWERLTKFVRKTGIRVSSKLASLQTSQRNYLGFLWTNKWENSFSRNVFTLRQAAVCRKKYSRALIWKLWSFI